MSDGRKNNGGKRVGAGSPGYSQLNFVSERANLILPLWWDEITKMLKGKNKTNKKFAISELNKIQIKMVPQDFNLGNKNGEVFKVIVEEYVKK